MKGWKKQPLPRHNKYTRRVGGKGYTIYPQPGERYVAAWALWQGNSRIGEFGTYGEAKDWFDKYIANDSE